MISPEEFKKLLEKYTEQTLTREEHELLMTCIRSEIYDSILLEHMDGKLNTDADKADGIPAYRSEEIIRRIVSAEKAASLLIPFRPAKQTWMKWMAAAVLVGLLAISAYYFLGSNTSSEPVAAKEVPNAYASSTSREYFQRINETPDPMSVELADGSIIILKPGAQIKYPRKFHQNKREVYLQGNAFFQIAKNSRQPFFVYSRDVVTRVIGTSFNVKMDAQKKIVEVAVRTGKVEVYEKNSSISAQSKKKNSVILLPNQKVIYSEDEQQFVASIVDEPLPLLTGHDEIVEQASELEEIPLSQLLTSLENTYGIEIVVENESIYKCLFTGDISKQNLFTKLEIICKTLNASFDIVGTRIMIRGKGCE